MMMRYVGGGVGHYHVDIPEDAAMPASIAEELDEDEEFPSTINIPIEVPEFPPVAPLSTAAHAVPEEIDDKSDSDSEPESDGEGEQGEGVGETDTGETPDLGPEDGDGFLPDEVNEGYAPL